MQSRFHCLCLIMASTSSSFLNCLRSQNQLLRSTSHHYWSPVVVKPSLQSIIKVTLRPIVSGLVCLVGELYLWSKTTILFNIRQQRICSYGKPSLIGWRFCHFHVFVWSPAQFYLPLMQNKGNFASRFLISFCNDHCLSSSDSAQLRSRSGRCLATDLPTISLPS